MSPTRPTTPFRLVAALLPALLVLPLLAGLAGTALPAFGWLPVLGAASWSLEPWRALLAEPGLATSLRLTLASGLGSTVLALMLAVTILAAGQGSRWLGIAERLLAPLLATPHVAFAVGLAFLLAPSGLIVRALSPWATGWRQPPDLATVQDPWGLALTLGLGLRETPFLLFTGLAALRQLEVAHQLAAARSLGAGRVTAWLRVVLPQLYPKLRLPVLAVLAYGLSVVDVAIVLGPSAPPTFAVQLLRWFTDPDLARRLEASAGALLLLLVTGAALAAWRLGERLAGAASARLGGMDPHPVLERAGGRLGAAAAAIVLGTGAVTLLVLAAWSMATRWRFPAFLPEELGFTTLRTQLGALAGPGLTTALLALVTTALALPLAVLALEGETDRGPRGRAIRLGPAWLPLLVPQIAFLFGLQVLLIVLRLDGTFAALVGVHLLYVLPYVLLTLQGPWLRLDRRYTAAARSLGRTRSGTLLAVKLPLALPALLAAAAIGFSVSVALFLPTVFAGAGRYPTLATEAVALSQSGDRRLVAVTALALAVLPLAVTAAALALGRRRPGRSGTIGGRVERD